VVGNIGFKPIPKKKADITKVIFADFEWKVEPSKTRQIK